MDTLLTSDIFLPLVAILILHAVSLGFMAMVLRLFRHVRRKEYDFLGRFSSPEGTGSGLLMHKKTPYLVGIYVVLTIGFALATVLVLIFQPHIL